MKSHPGLLSHNAHQQKLIPVLLVTIAIIFSNLRPATEQFSWFGNFPIQIFKIAFHSSVIPSLRNLDEKKNRPFLPPPPDADQILFQLIELSHHPSQPFRISSCTISNMAYIKCINSGMTTAKGHSYNRDPCAWPMSSACPLTCHHIPAYLTEIEGI